MIMKSTHHWLSVHGTLIHGHLCRMLNPSGRREGLHLGQEMYKPQRYISIHVDESAWKFSSPTFLQLLKHATHRNYD